MASSSSSSSSGNPKRRREEENDDDAAETLATRIFQWLAIRSVHEGMHEFKLSDVKHQFETITSVLVAPAVAILIKEGKVIVPKARSRIMVYSVNVEQALLVAPSLPDSPARQSLLDGQTTKSKKPTPTKNEINWKTHVFQVGEKLSFVAEPEGLWNEIEVLEMVKPPGKPPKMLIRYFGWHFEFHWSVYDEWIILNNDDIFHRFAPLGTGVHRVKCFVNLGPGLSLWPCFALIRQPATMDAQTELKKYNHIYVEPFGNPEAFQQIFKKKTTLNIPQGVHVKYIEHHEAQVVPYTEGRRLANDKLKTLTGTKHDQYYEALQQQKRSHLSESDFNLYGLLPIEEEENDSQEHLAKKVKPTKEKPTKTISGLKGVDKTKTRLPLPFLRRQYYHPNSYVPLCDLGATRDFFKDIDMRWKVDLSNQYLAEYEDVAIEEKVFFQMWNTHIEVDMGGFYSKKYLPWYCEQFIVNYGQEIHKKKLRFQALAHFFYLIDVKMLRKEEVLVIMAKLDAMVDQAESTSLSSSTEPTTAVAAEPTATASSSSSSSSSSHGYDGNTNDH